jgi:hypothetical protein
MRLAGGKYGALQSLCRLQQDQLSRRGSPAGRRIADLVIRPKETQEIEVEANSYTEGREAILARIPEGWELLSAMPVR